MSSDWCLQYNLILSRTAAFLFCFEELLVGVCVSAPYVCGAPEGQKRALGALELELQTVLGHHTSAVI